MFLGRERKAMTGVWDSECRDFDREFADMMGNMKCGYPVCSNKMGARLVDSSCSIMV